MKRTITVDLDAIRHQVRSIAEDNGGLETSGGMTPAELDLARSVLARCPAMDPFNDLFSEILAIHYEEHENNV